VSITLSWRGWSKIRGVRAGDISVLHEGPEQTWHRPRGFGVAQQQEQYDSRLVPQKQAIRLDVCLRLGPEMTVHVQRERMRGGLAEQRR
jgi:hypothetical protein